MIPLKESRRAVGRVRKGALPPALAGLPRSISAKKKHHARRVFGWEASAPEVSHSPAAQTMHTGNFKKKLPQYNRIGVGIERQARFRSESVMRILALGDNDL
ncbi:hypothetical protein RA20_16440 [Leisingera sp. ANG-Vp]|nr:hypothetical protein RA20_16440 [Leisingera sp. ANG-Vp]